MSNEEIKATIQDIHDNVYKQGKADGRAEVIEDLLKQVKKEEMWLFEVIGSNQNINIAFGGIYAKAEQLKGNK